MVISQLHFQDLLLSAVYLKDTTWCICSQSISTCFKFLLHVVFVFLLKNRYTDDVKLFPIVVNSTNQYHWSIFMASKRKTSSRTEVGEGRKLLNLNGTAFFLSLLRIPWLGGQKLIPIVFFLVSFSTFLFLLLQTFFKISWQKHFIF